MKDRDERCAWCSEPESEHGGMLSVGCDEFVPIDWRARAHAILDRLIDGSRQSSFAIADGDWLSKSLRLRGAVIRAQEETEIVLS